MGVFTRFKRDSDGFRALVELWESTPIERRKRMIDVGMQEDPDFVERALEYVMTFEDIMAMNDSEIAELMSVAPGRITALAIAPLTDDEQKRFVRCSKPPVAEEIKTYLENQPGLREVGGARLKLVEFARGLEKRGLIKTKRIPA